MDNVIKKYFDKYRKQNKLPPEIKGKVKGRLMLDIELMKKWRNWRVGLRFFDEDLGAELSGALDDCLVDGRSYIPLDYKTRGYAPKEETKEFYQSQLDVYCLLLEENGYKTSNFAYLLYYYPKTVKENGLVEFNVEPVKVETSVERAHKLFKEAVKYLNGPVPERHSECKYCSWVGDLSGFD
jgi:CRISPR/Cas system-associated exonuclease Cas4 (RecB family)